MVIIIGAGLTGLVAAFELKQKGIPFRLLEASHQPGGNIRTIIDDGCIVELGPNSLQVTQETLDWLDHAKLAKHVVEASRAARVRWLLRDGAYRKAPSGPLSLLFSGYFSLGARWRILRESSVPKGTDPLESVDRFFRRRIGDEATEYAVYPFVSGVYAGNPGQLAVQYAFPALYRAEQEFGSLMTGLRKGPASGRKVITFRKGLYQLAESIYDQVEDETMLHTPVQLVRKAGRAWELQTAQGLMEATCVVSCIPFPAIKKLLTETSLPDVHIDYPHVAVVTSLYDTSAFRHIPSGFGALHTPKENPGTLGVVFSSSVFPHRAPKGKVMLTTFVGGAMNPSLATASDGEILERVDADHRTFLQITRHPEKVWLQRWQSAIPQYGPAIAELHAWAGHMETDNWFSGGNWVGGISLPDCIRRGRYLAEKVAALYR